MKDLLKTNCFDIQETMIIVGSCLKSMQPKAYEELEHISSNIYDVCLEKEHLNMVVTKIIGMIARGKIKNLIFATVDKSPHCVQLHYIIKELENAIDISNIKIINYVAVNDKLIEIPLEVISLSKNLSKLKEKNIVYRKEINMLEDFESISPTAITASYSRTFTDIPYEKEIYEWLNANCKNDRITLNKLWAPEVEARYKLINKILDDLKFKQVLELAAGYSSRGLIYSKREYNYIEMDLDNVAQNKIRLLKDITEIPNNLHIISGNALDYSDYNKCEEYFNENEEIAIVNEGLLRYLTFEEKEIVAKNIYKILKQHSGVWITCDVTPKKFIKKQNECLQDFNKNLSSVTSRNDLQDRFNDIEHIKNFMGNIGFNNVEIHKFIEMKEQLTSFRILGVDPKKYDELLENAIVAVIRI